MTARTADDASGRGVAQGFAVPFPARMTGYTEEEIAAVVDVMRNADALTQSRYMRQFEADFSEYNGSPHAFAVDNCTNALRLAAMLCRLKPGDEVIIPAYTFCATAIPFGETGAKIVWADIDPERRVISPEDVERKITKNTRAIVVVHLLGMPVDMDPIMELARKHNLRVVEDCAQAPGAMYKGRKVGAISDFGCFSFHGAKNITTLGEGAMLTVASDEDAALVPGLRHNGCRAFTGTRERDWVPAMSSVDVDVPGVWPQNFCLGEAQCALGIELLKRLDNINDTLMAQAQRIREGIADLPEITMHALPSDCRHVYHQFVLHFENESINATRDDLMDILVKEQRIRAVVQYYPLYRYPLFRKMGFGEHDCPILEAWWDHSFSLPWWCGIPDETLDFLVVALKNTVQRLKGKA